MIALFLAATMLNVEVRQDTVATTICQPHYSSTYRRHHPVRIPTRPGMVRDHIVSLELGGSSDRSNLQYQTRADSLRKDREERRLNRSVCSGKIQLRDAQARMEEWKP